MSEVVQEVNKDNLVKLEAVKLADMVVELRNENASRRISNKEIEAEKQKLAKQNEDLQLKLTNLETQLGEFSGLKDIVSKYEKDKKEKEQADLTEVEKLKSIVDDQNKVFAESESKLKKELEKLQSKLSERDNIIKQKDLLFKRSILENNIANLATDNDFKFRSEYERKGLLDDILRPDESGNLPDVDDIKSKFLKFVEENKSTPSAAPAAPQTVDNGGSSDVDIKRFNELNTKAKAYKITPDERTELNKLITKITGSM